MTFTLFLFIISSLKLNIIWEWRGTHELWYPAAILEISASSGVSKASLSAFAIKSQTSADFLQCKGQKLEHFHFNNS